MREDCFFAADCDADDFRDEDRFAEDRFAEDRLAAERFAEDRLAEDRLADGRFEEDRFADDLVSESSAADLRDRLLVLVSPASRRCLFTVAAAMRFAIAVLRPCFLAEDLIFSY